MVSISAKPTSNISSIKQSFKISNNSSKTSLVSNIKANLDKVEINSMKKGAGQTFKGIGSGLLIGAGGGIASAVAIESVKHMGSGALALLGIPMVAAPAAMVAGGIVANTTDDPATGALIGVVSGAITGGAVGALGGNAQFAGMGAGIGAVAGGISGFVSSFLAEKK